MRKLVYSFLKGSIDMNDELRKQVDRAIEAEKERSRVESERQQADQRASDASQAREERLKSFQETLLKGSDRLKGNRLFIEKAQNYGYDPRGGVPIACDVVFKPLDAGPSSTRGTMLFWRTDAHSGYDAVGRLFDKHWVLVREDGQLAKLKFDETSFRFCRGSLDALTVVRNGALSVVSEVVPNIDEMAEEWLMSRLPR